MEHVKKLLLPAIALLLFFGLYSLVSYFSRNSIEELLSSSEPFAIRLALVNDQTDGPEVLAQMIVFPEERHILFYFINTDAAFEAGGKSLREMRLDSADRFVSYTGISNKFQMRIKLSDAVRLIDLIGGMNYFIEEPIEFEKGLFTYPTGIHHFPGEQAVEFSTARTKAERGREYMVGVEQLLRAESLLLTAFWERKRILDSLDAVEMWSAAVGLLDTNLNPDELQSLAEFLNGKKSVNASVLEVPLEIAEAPAQYPPVPAKLLVKEKRARSVYNDFIDTFRSGRLLGDAFSIEIRNGTEISGVARKLKFYFQDRGLSVLDVNNYPYKPVMKTTIVDRSGNTYYAEKFVEMAETERERVFFRRKNFEVNISYIVGEDVDRKKMHL